MQTNLRPPVKLLFDQNLSCRIIEGLVSDYPGSTHVQWENLAQVDDETIWNFARNSGYVIVSKEATFQQRSLVRGFPPKVILVRCGNASTSQIERLLTENYTAIQNFCDDPVDPFHIIG